jgi:hypothetical protein
VIAVPPPVHPWPIGAGPSYHPTAANQAVLEGSPVGRLRCTNGRRFAVHIELFARRQVVIVPPGIGVARSGCSYPLRTNTPTGVVEVLAGRRFTLGDLFRVWGRRVDATHLLSFRGRVSVFVGGKHRTGDPQHLVLTKHAEIVIEIGGYVAPHPSYLFPRGGP